jgi:LuxR family maltose regulon positive regulatory protein
MALLLRAAARRGPAHPHARRLLRVLDSTDATPDRPAAFRAMESLSTRERDVLRLLETQLSGPEIARELVVSLNTVRTHTKNIYAKFGVNNRREAVLRAEELGMSTRTRSLER